MVVICHIFGTLKLALNVRQKSKDLSVKITMLITAYLMIKNLLKLKLINLVAVHQSLKMTLCFFLVMNLLVNH
jgi:hypothetical protein